MSEFFKKAAIFTDIHYGNKTNSIIHNEDCVSFIKWFIETAHSNNCDACFFLGDYFHNRNNTNLITMNYGLQGLQLLSKAFNEVIMLPGNHDLFYKDQRTISSIAWAEHIPNIRILNEWTKKEDVILFFPSLAFFGTSVIIFKNHSSIINAKKNFLLLFKKKMRF